MPKLTINGTEIEVAPGTSILQAAESLGYEIPRFCYHDRLSVPGNCRMCLVEVEGAPKPVASCAMAAGEGMIVHTDTDRVRRARQNVMEFLLINHPLDCPICDQGGECDLQDQAVAYGYDRSRYRESKRAVPNKNIGPLIKTIMTRCIQCTRCVRFGEEIAGVTELGLLHRGEDVEIGTFVEKAVSTELSGNMIDICPVGALTSAPYAYKARPWELRKTQSIDISDAAGSNIRIDSRGNEVLRILPRLHEGINEEWISDKARFCYDGVSRGRLDTPWLRDEPGAKLRPVSWEEALTFVAGRLRKIRAKDMAALAGDLADLESVVALKDLMTQLGTPHLDCRMDGARFDPSSRANYLFNTTIAGLERADCILLVGTNPRWESTMINARIRKAWRQKKGALPVGLIGEEADLTYPVEHIGETAAALKEIIGGKHPFAKKMKAAQNPVLIVGSAVFAREDHGAIAHLLGELARKYDIIRDGWNGMNMLHGAAGRTGALDVGFVPQAPDARGMAEIIEGTRSGAVKALYLLGTDEFNARADIGWQCFVVYQGHHGDHAAMRADVILPGAAWTEQDGTYVNVEGRPQFARQAVSPPGEAKENWKIIRALAERLNIRLPYDTSAHISARIAADWPHLAKWDVLPDHTEIGAWDLKGEKGDLSGGVLASPVRNYYMTNPLCRASEIMARCHAAFPKGRDADSGSEDKTEQEAAE